MKNSSFPSPGLRNFIWWFLLAALAILFVFLGAFSFHREIFQFDSYQYLYNSHSIATGGDRFTACAPYRSPLLQFIYAPFLYFLAPGTSLSFQMHFLSLLSLVFTGLFLFVVYRFHRLFFSPLLSLLLVFFLACNRLVLHYASEPMTGIPGATLVVLALYFFILGLQNPPRRSPFFFWAGIASGLALTIRFNLGLWIPILGLSFLWPFLGRKRSFFKNKKAWKFSSFLLLLPFALAYIFYYFYYALITGKGDIFYYRNILSFLGFVKKMNLPTDIWGEYFIYVFASGGVALAGLAALGVIFSLKKLRKREVPCLLSVLFFFGAISLLSHAEGRYLIPILPLLYHFVGRSLEEIFSLKIKIAAPILALVILSVGFRTSQEYFTLREDFYRVPFVSQTAQNLEEKKDLPLYWVGGMYALFPENYPQWYHFTRYDEFYHFYHLFAYPYELHLKRKIIYLGENLPLAPLESKTPFLPNALSKVGTPSVLIYSGKEDHFSHRYHPKQPLIIGTLKREELSLTDRGFESENFELNSDPEGRLKTAKALYPFQLYGEEKGELIYIGLFRKEGDFLAYFNQSHRKMTLSRKFLKSKGLGQGARLLVAYQELEVFPRDLAGKKGRPRQRER